MESCAERFTVSDEARDCTREAFEDSVHAVVGGAEMNLRPLGTRILQNGYGDTIVVAEIERRGRKDYIPAENWSELEPAARDHLESLGISTSETGNYECPQHIAERARFGFEVFWAQSGLPLGEALAEWRRQWLGVNNYSVFAFRHDVSPRTVRMLEKYNRIPKPDYTRRQLELAYMLPKGFLGGLLEEQQGAR
jgi:hypothetical protein